MIKIYNIIAMILSVIIVLTFVLLFYFALSFCKNDITIYLYNDYVTVIENVNSYTTDVYGNITIYRGKTKSIYNCFYMIIDNGEIITNINNDIYMRDRSYR